MVFTSEFATLTEHGTFQMKCGQVPFDEKAAEEMADGEPARVGGARWQFEQDKARIALAESDDDTWPPESAPQRAFMELAAVGQAAMAEVTRARSNWPPFNTAHEGFAVLLEEVDELKAHVWTNQKRRDLAAMKKEAIQVAAMALRFAAEVCSEETGRK